MKKRKISLIIIALAMALCMALCIILPACSSDDKKDNSSDHTHTYNVLKYDDENHWYECSCGEVSPDDPVPHASENGYKYDDDNHWQVCDVCEQKFGTEEHEITNDKCDVCGYEPEVHTHKYTKQNYDETSHWNECECGEIDESSIEAHDSNAYSSDAEYHWAVCSVCGYYDKSDDSVKVQHSVTDTAYESDRTYHWHECEVCGEVFDKAEHSLGDDDTCTICGYEKGELTSTTIYMVGDSTMCAFEDKIYIPRYGYGTQLANFLTDDVDENGDPLITVENLAMSGRSSKSFTTESNYTTLWNSIQEGDYLIIGFGHNDEKDTDSKLYTSANVGLGQSTDDVMGFQDSLYNNYIEPAIEKGATPILCTPIVRYSTTANFTGSNGHITEVGGNYPQAIRDLGNTKGVDVIDLTATTAADYTQIGSNAVWYHSYNSAEKVEDSSTDPMARVVKDVDGNDVTVVPSGMDSTHLNKYGAKMVSYEFVTELADTTSSLKDYIAEDVVKPTMDGDFGEDVYYAGYVYAPYTSFDPNTYSTENTLWTGFPVENTSGTWYATEFGDVGGASHISSSEFIASYDSTSNVFTVGHNSTNSTNTTSRGKLSDSQDGIVGVFMQISVEDNFTATANVKITGICSDNGGSSPTQSGFGIMLRDDIYINEYSTSISSDYGVAGVRGITSSSANFYKLSSKITNGGTLSSAIAINDTFELELSRESQSVYMTTELSNGTEYTLSQQDLNFYVVDEDYIYLCLFATRGITCEFSNVTYTKTGTAQGA